jgi:hypothetical protein
MTRRVRPKLPNNWNPASPQMHKARLFTKNKYADIVQIYSNKGRCNWNYRWEHITVKDFLWGMH